MTNGYCISIEIQDGEIEQIMDEMKKAMRTVQDCYYRLEALGVVTVQTRMELEIAYGFAERFCIHEKHPPFLDSAGGTACFLV
jgi:hypothetical protein